MPKSLRQTRWTRLRDFFRGLVLYGTVYWRRASDEAKRINAAPVVRSRAEREELAPQIDPSLVRPRVRARPMEVEANLLAASGSGSLPDAEKAASIATATALVAALTKALAQSQTGDQVPKPSPVSAGALKEESTAAKSSDGQPRTNGIGAFVRQRQRRSDQTVESAPGVLSFNLRRKRRRSFWRRLLRLK